MMPALALADITVTGKTSSTIKAYVRPLEFIEVTNELGGWQTTWKCNSWVAGTRP